MYIIYYEKYYSTSVKVLNIFQSIKFYFENRIISLIWFCLVDLTWNYNFLEFYVFYYILIYYTILLCTTYKFQDKFQDTIKDKPMDIYYILHWRFNQLITIKIIQK